MQIEAPPSQQVYKLQGSSLLETWISAVIQTNKKECLERKKPKIYKANWSMDKNRNQIKKISNKKFTEIIFFIVFILICYIILFWSIMLCLKSKQKYQTHSDFTSKNFYFIKFCLQRIQESVLSWLYN